MRLINTLNENDLLQIPYTDPTELDSELFKYYTMANRLSKDQAYEMCSTLIRLREAGILIVRYEGDVHRIVVTRSPLTQARVLVRQAEGFHIPITGTMFLSYHQKPLGDIATHLFGVRSPYVNRNKSIPYVPYQGIRTTSLIRHVTTKLLLDNGLLVSLHGLGTLKTIPKLQAQYPDQFIPTLVRSR